jgi:phage shock protein C
MYCTNCGNQLQATDRFCPQCAKRTGLGAPAPAPSRRLSLPREGKKVAGVCAGFARYFDTDVTLMRVLWLAVAVSTGVGFIAYLVAWLIMPKDEPLSAAPATPVERAA